MAHFGILDNQMETTVQGSGFLVNPNYSPSQQLSFKRLYSGAIVPPSTSLVVDVTVRVRDFRLRV